MRSLIVILLALMSSTGGVEMAEIGPALVVDGYSDTGRWIGHRVVDIQPPIDAFQALPFWRVEAVLFNPGEGLLDLRLLAELNGWDFPPMHATPKRISLDGCTIYGTGSWERHDWHSYVVERRQWIWTMQLPKGLLWPLAGDFDHDGDLDQSDFGLLQVQLGQYFVEASPYDINKDGHIDTRDVKAWIVERDKR